MNPFEAQFEAENKADMLFTAHMRLPKGDYYDWYVDYLRNCVIAVGVEGEVYAIHKYQFEDNNDLSRHASAIWEAVDMAMFKQLHHIRNRRTPISPDEGKRLIDGHIVSTFKNLFPELTDRRRRAQRFTLAHYA